MSAIKEQIKDDLAKLKTNAIWARRLEAFRAVFEKSDRILSGHPVTVAMSIDGNTPGIGSAGIPGWTDGETIFLNADVIRNDLGKLSMADIVLHTKAVNYHELCHVIYSPRMRDDIMKWVHKQVTDTNSMLWWYAFNALEDQRIESLFTAKYRPAGRYFEVIALKWLVNNQASISEAYPLVYGRKFLRRDIVDKARTAFEARYGAPLARAFEKVIDRFTILKFPDHTVAGQKAITEYKDLLDKMMAMHPQMNGMPTPSLMSDDNGGAQGASNPSSDPTVIRKNNARKRDQQSAIDSLPNITPNEPPKKSEKSDDSDKGKGKGDGDDQDGGDDQDSDDGDGKEGKGKSQSTSGAGKTDQGSDDGSGGDDDSDDSGESNASGGDQSATGASTGGTPAPEQDMLDAVYDALDDLFNDESFQDELKDTARAIHQAMGTEGLASGENIAYQIKSVSPDVVRAAKKMSLQLSRLRTELEEQHLYRQTAGQIHPRRFLSRQPWEVDFFKVYEPGQVESTDLEAVVLVDLSYSMASYMGSVNEALWCVKRALDALDSRVTVLGFSEASYVLYQPIDKVGKTTMRYFSARSGTTPDAALEEANRLFRVSTRTQKLLVSITDGAWQGDQQKQDRLVDSMKAMEVVTCLIGIGQAPHGVHHQHEIVHMLSGIQDMPRIAVEIVASALRKLMVSVPSA